MAVADASYKFTYFDVGGFGSEGDANIFEACKLGQSLLKGELSFPPDQDVGGKKVPFYYVADDAFPLNKRIMKPYPGKKLTEEQTVFNYRLSRARRCIENTFGILTMKWLCLRRPMLCTPERAQKIIAACCYLHNFLMERQQKEYVPASFENLNVESTQRTQASDNLSAGYRGRNCDEGKFVRDYLKDFVNGCGSVDWQRKACFL